jgi:hypothetical protein
MKLKEFIQTFEHTLTQEMHGTFNARSLEKVKEILLQCEEFKGVKKLNFLTLPNFMANKKTGDPLEPLNRDSLPGEETYSERVVTYKFTTNLEFNEVVDLYSIGLSPRIYDENFIENLKDGLWSLPQVLGDFVSKKEIRFIFSREKLQDMQGLHPETFEQFVNKTVEDFRKFITSDEVNVPSKKAIMLRVSPRSIKNTVLRNESDIYID